MLRHRLITVLTFNDGTLFRTKLFEPDYRYTHNFVDSWLVDEIVMLDVTRKEGDNQAFLDVVTQFAHDCFVPRLQVVDRPNVLLGNNQHMHGGLRIDIPEREDIICFVDDVSGNS